MTSRTTSTDPATAGFIYGGVRFVVPRHFVVDLVPQDTAPPTSHAHAWVDVKVHAATVDETPRPIRWVRAGEVVRLGTMGLAAEIRALGPDRFVAEVHVSPSLNDLAQGLAETLATTLAELHGGVVLHTAAIVHHGEAVLFVGRSGAGKSTAARLVPGALELSADRAAVVPRAGADDCWDVFPLRVGTPSGLPMAATTSYPLAAILDVRRDGTRSGIEPASAMQRLALLRAASSTGGDAGHQLALLDRLEALGRAVPVASVYTRLDHPVDLSTLPIRV